MAFPPKPTGSAPAGAPPFAKKSGSKPAFGKKTGKVAPAQKALMSSGRSMRGGGRC